TRFSRDWSSDVCSSDLGRGEDVADGDAGAQAPPHVPEEQRHVARAATGDDADLAAGPGVGADEGTAVLGGRAQLVRVRQQQSVDDLVDEVVRVVDDLLHYSSSFFSRR